MLTPHGKGVVRTWISNEKGDSPGAAGMPTSAKRRPGEAGNRNLTATEQHAEERFIQSVEEVHRLKQVDLEANPKDS